MKLLRPQLAVAAACALVISVQVVLFQNAAAQKEAVRWVTHTHEVIQELELVPSGIAQAESALGGWLLTHQPEVLAPFSSGLRRAKRGYQRALLLTRDNAQQQGRLIQLGKALHARTERLRFMSTHGAANPPARVSGDQLMLTISIREQTDEVIAEEQKLLTSRTSKSAIITERLDTAVLLGALASALLFAPAMWALREEDRRRRRAERELNRRVELGQLLQSCREPIEVYALVQRQLQRTFPGCSGNIYTVHPSRTVLESQAGWGPMSGKSVVHPDECWALRRGQAHLVDFAEGSMSCLHASEGNLGSSACFPLAAQGEVVGVLHVRHEGLSTALHDAVQPLIDGIAIALANQALNEALRVQSIRDPLTGLYNRRYFEDTCDRELRAAARSSTPLAILFLDVDHFKTFNDTFGHAGGDLVLRELGGVLRASARDSDVAARYGGEEFALLLPGVDRERAVQRAEAIRRSVATLEVTHQGMMLGAITISIGIAWFPDLGKTREDLVRAADAALYAAKRGGRDRFALGVRTPHRPSMPVTEIRSG